MKKSINISIRVHQAFLALILFAVPSLCRASGPVFGVGQSSNGEAKAAGIEAASKAKAGLGGAEPKAVLVFAARPQLDPQLVEGVAGVFERNLIYGCEGYASLTPEGNFCEGGHSILKGVSVLAIGGDVTIVPAWAKVAKPAVKVDRAKVYRENGNALGEALKPAYAAASAGKLVLTFGNQHVGDNQPFVEGMAKVLGKEVKMVGAAAGGETAKEIVRGEIVKGGNVALLMTGNFTVRTAAAHGEEVATADQAFKAVVGIGGEKLVFVFDCGGRRGNMIKAGTLRQEWEVMQSNAGKVPFFGFYGGGEIGHKTATGPSEGVGVHIVTAAIISQ